MTFWNDTHDSTLTTLWTAGILSCAAIGTAIGCNKNMVIGRAHRLKLPPKIPAKGRKARKPRRDISLARAHYRQRILKSKPVENDLPRPTPVPEFEAEPIIEMAEIFIPVENRLRLLQLNEHTCKWPIGDPLTPDFYFCGCHAEEGKAYCEFHARRARGTGTVGEREAVKVSKKLRLVEV